MKNQWYADPKDIPKWAAVANLLPAGTGRTLLLYVPMLRESPAIPRLHRNGVSLDDVHEAVPAHFRDVTSLRHFAALLPVEWQIADGPFIEGMRKSYFGDVCTRLSVRAEGVGAVVLIDPDDGIAPRRPGPDPEAHVHPHDLARVFKHMRSGDTLAVYQHINRRANHHRLLQHAVTRFRDALAVWPDVEIESYTMPDFTKEAAVLAAKMP